MTQLNIFTKIFGILTSEERKQLKYILLLMIIGMFFETFGIAIIIPFIGLLMSDNYLQRYPQLNELFNLLGNSTQEQFIFKTIKATF